LLRKTAKGSAAKAAFWRIGKPRRNGVWLIEFLISEVVVFVGFIFRSFGIVDCNPVSAWNYEPS
jgi:hypothetical protein